MPRNSAFNETEENYSIHSSLRSVISIFLIITSVSGNSLVLFAIYRFRRLRTISNTIIANLSLADVLFSVFVASINAFYWSQEEKMPAGVSCHISGVGALLFGLTSIYTLVFVSIERFLATKYPVKHRNTFSVRTVKYGLVGIWLWSGAICVMTFAASRYVYIERFYHCTLDWPGSFVFTMAIFILGNALPLITLIICNGSVLKTAHEKKQILSSPADPMSQRAFRARIQREMRISLIIVAVIVVFASSWTPYSITMVCLSIDGCTLPQEFISGAVLLTIANGCFNPFIYGVMNKNYRAAFAAIFGLTS